MTSKSSSISKSFVDNFPHSLLALICILLVLFLFVWFVLDKMNCCCVKGRGSLLEESQATYTKEQETTEQDDEADQYSDSSDDDSDSDRQNDTRQEDDGDSSDNDHDEEMGYNRTKEAYISECDVDCELRKSQSDQE